MKFRLAGRIVLIALACAFGIGAVHYAIAIENAKDPNDLLDIKDFTRALTYALLALTCVTGIRYFED